MTFPEDIISIYRSSGRTSAVRVADSNPLSRYEVRHPDPVTSPAEVFDTRTGRLVASFYNAAPSPTPTRPGKTHIERAHEYATQLGLEQMQRQDADRARQELLEIIRRQLNGLDPQRMIDLRNIAKNTRLLTLELPGEVWRG